MTKQTYLLLSMLIGSCFFSQSYPAMPPDTTVDKIDQFVKDDAINFFASHSDQFLKSVKKNQDAFLSHLKSELESETDREDDSGSENNNDQKETFSFCQDHTQNTDLNCHLCVLEKHVTDLLMERTSFLLNNCHCDMPHSTLDNEEFCKKYQLQKVSEDEFREKLIKRFSNYKDFTNSILKIIKKWLKILIELPKTQ